MTEDDPYAWAPLNRQKFGVRRGFLAGGKFRLVYRAGSATAYNIAVAGSGQFGNSRDIEFVGHVGWNRYARLLDLLEAGRAPNPPAAL
jgi:hypothetical protein